MGLKSEELVDKNQAPFTAVYGMVQAGDQVISGGCWDDGLPAQLLSTL